MTLPCVWCQALAAEMLGQRQLLPSHNDTLLLRVTGSELLNAFEGVFYWLGWTIMLPDSLPWSGDQESVSDSVHVNWIKG